MDDLPDVCLSAVLERAAARPQAQPAWAAIVQVCRRWRRLARAAIAELSLRVRGGGHGSPGRPGEPAMLGPALVATIPSLRASVLTSATCEATVTPPDSTSCRLSRRSPTCESGWRVFVHSMMTTTTLRTCSRNFGAISLLRNVVRALTLDDTRLYFSLAVIAGFTALESLSLTYSRAADADIHIIAAACRHLTELELWLSNERTHWSARITDVGLESISKHVPQLRKLHIRDCTSITDNGIMQLAIGCSLLQDFRILRTCPEMRRLRCQKNWSCHWLHSAPTATFDMSRLEVLECYVPDGEAVTSTAMATLASCCTQLRELHVHTICIPHPDGSRPDPLENCPPTPALVNLSMRGFTLRITSFLAFLFNAPQLERLSLEACDLVGSIQALPAISSLRFLECRSLFFKPAVDFWQFGKWCPDLTSLTTIMSHRGANMMQQIGDSQSWGLFWGTSGATLVDLSSTGSLESNNLHESALARLGCNHKGVTAFARSESERLRTVNVEVVLDLLSLWSELHYILALLFRFGRWLSKRSAHSPRHVNEVVHLELVDGDWGLDWGDYDPDRIEAISTTYRVHRCGQWEDVVVQLLHQVRAMIGCMVTRIHLQHRSESKRGPV
eukprot:SM000095S24955  [mRNA]  locus=s95:124323:126730:+ [translate_table: standard]